MQCILIDPSEEIWLTAALGQSDNGIRAHPRIPLSAAITLDKQTVRHDMILNEFGLHAAIFFIIM